MLGSLDYDILGAYSICAIPYSDVPINLVIQQAVKDSEQSVSFSDSNARQFGLNNLMGSTVDEHMMTVMGHRLQEFIAATINLKKIEREENLFVAFSYFDKDNITGQKVTENLSVVGLLYVMQGLPMFEGGFQATRSVVRPFVGANFHVGGSSPHGGSIEMQVPRHVLDFTETLFPSSQDPMMDDSQAPAEGVANQSVGIEDVQVPARCRWQSAICNAQQKPPARDVVKARLYWHEAATMALIEPKIEEQDEEDGRTGRENMLTADQKYKLIEEKLARKRIIVPAGKSQGKWEKLDTEYRNLEGQVASSPYWSMDSAQHGATKCPGNFSEQVFCAMDSFLGSRPAVNCVLSESSPIDSPES
ncbi:hypothetical protein R1sor_017508 [Riccia sorocarpa]|uniref:Uncharacterized protein n=1 Tax=Riccia sorocarpa TaxID=122646 RepID=A0ABD3I7F1_9MARC